MQRGRGSDLAYRHGMTAPANGYVSSALAAASSLSHASQSAWSGDPRSASSIAQLTFLPESRDTWPDAELSSPVCTDGIGEMERQPWIRFREPFDQAIRRIVASPEVVLDGAATSRNRPLDVGGVTFRSPPRKSPGVRARRGKIEQIRTL